MKRFLGFLCCLALLLGLSPAKTALAVVDWPSGVSISADGGILMDANSGAVLYGKNIHEQYYPASITKILTALVILENCGLDDTVTFSYNAVNNLEPNSTILGARAGDTLSVRDCLYALLLQSANEVANALAEHCSGDIESFAELMNRKAESLGCTDSHFANPSGLNDENHYTSAHDMALTTAESVIHIRSKYVCRNDQHDGNDQQKRRDRKSDTAKFAIAHLYFVRHKFLLFQVSFVPIIQEELQPFNARRRIPSSQRPNPLSQSGNISEPIKKTFFL